MINYPNVDQLSAKGRLDPDSHRLGLSGHARHRAKFDEILPALYSLRMAVSGRARAYLRSVALVIIAVAAAAVTVWASSRAGDARLASSTRGWWLLVAVVAAGTATGLPLVDRFRLAIEAQQSRISTRVAFNDTLDPIIRQLGRIAEANKRDRDGLQKQIIPMILNSAAELLDPDRARVCWFEYRPAPTPRLVPGVHKGRSGAPRTVFEEGTPEGDGALRLLKKDRYLVCSDVDKDPPPGWSKLEHAEYKCFIAVPAMAGGVAYGMLTVDALEPRVLTTDDVPMLRSLASLLACALAIRP